jgi:hypothetical protein
VDCLFFSLLRWTSYCCFALPVVRNGAVGAELPGQLILPRPAIDLGQAPPQASTAFKPDSNGNWWIEQEHFAADFAADLPKDQAQFMAISQVPISTEAFTHKVTNPAWKTKPTWYMVATEDRSIRSRSA